MADLDSVNGPGAAVRITDSHLLPCAALRPEILSASYEIKGLSLDGMWLTGVVWTDELVMITQHSLQPIDSEKSD
jgi:hypothetical protein